VPLFNPRLDILPPPQRRLWNELRDVPVDFVLYGGTAIALHLGHRQSIDFDFFGNRPYDPVKLVRDIPFMADATITQMEPGTVSANINRGGTIKVSFFDVAGTPRLKPPLIAPDNGLQIASLLDLAGMKAKVVLQRAEAKDYLDIDALLTMGGLDLPTVLAAARAIYGKTYTPLSTLKALSYFDDGNLRRLRESVRSRLLEAAREVDLNELPTIVPYHDRGQNQGKSR
jgi:hypothetical protein